MFISNNYHTLTNNIIFVIPHTMAKTMKSYSSKEVIKVLESDGWYEVNCVGSHHQFKHPTKKGRVTVSHPLKIFLQAH